MTAGEIVNNADILCPNGFVQSEKLSWLYNHDVKMLAKLKSAYSDSWIKTALDNMPGAYTPASTLAVDSPFMKDVYLYYLIALINLHSGETERYNECVTLYSGAMSAFMNYYNKSHLPNGEKRWKF